MACYSLDVFPGYSSSDIKRLLSSVSKRGIWRLYKAAMEGCGGRAAAYYTFCRLWTTLLPSVVVMKPMSDLVGPASSLVLGFYVQLVQMLPSQMVYR